MDESAAKVRLQQIAPPEEIKKLQKDLENTKKEKDSVLAAQDYEKAAALRDKISELEKKAKEWKAASATPEPTVTEDDIASVVSDWTGIPVVKLTAAETEKLIHMEGELHKRIIGQDEAVTAISQAIRRDRK